MSTALAAPSFADFWSEVLAPKFVRFRTVLVEGGKPHGQRAMRHFPPTPGTRVLDIGCGFGDTTLELAAQVGPSGSALGLDVVPAFLTFGEQAAAEASADNVSFVQADAETCELDGSFDYLFARFGTMFFERPGAAFRNLRAMLKPEGQLVMTTWRALEQNPWLALAKEVARAHLPPLGDAAVSCGPGPFSLTDQELVRGLLECAGFRDVSFVASDAFALLGSSLEAAVDFQLALGPAGELVREAGRAGEQALPRLRQAMAAALRPFLSESGVRLRSAAWIVRARA